VHEHGGTMLMEHLKKGVLVNRMTDGELAG
jgi:hypothetical protein